MNLVKKLPCPTLDALEISGNEWAKTGFHSYASTEYPQFDVCAIENPEPAYDLIIAEQVFEHILWPFRAGRNVYSLLRPGGHFLITTPFLLPIHEVPYDCTRWTPTGMKYFLAECGFSLESIQTFSWGNEGCVKANLKRWTPFFQWRHSLNNSPKHPVVVWALAQKGLKSAQHHE